MKTAKVEKEETLLVPFRISAPLFPSGTNRKELEEDLQRMGCLGLITRPWVLKDEAMAAELRHPPPKKDSGSLRRNPQKWESSHWRAVYGLHASGVGMCSRTDSFAKDQFSSPLDAKNGYLVKDCKDPRARRFLEFIVPILYPEKSARATVTLANTLCGAFKGERVVDWAELIRDVVAKQVKAVVKGKISSISAFLFHLYHFHDLLSGSERVKYETACTMARHGIAPEVEKVELSEDSEQESEEEEIKPRHSKRKADSREETSQQKKAKGISPPSALRLDDPFGKCLEGIGAAREKYLERQHLVERIGEILGGVEESSLEKEVEELVQPRGGGESSKRVKELEEELALVSIRLKSAETELEEDRRKQVKALSSIEEIRQFLTNTGDEVNQAKLFSEDLLKAGGVPGAAIVNVLVEYGQKMEGTLEQMRKISEAIPFPPKRILPPPASTPKKSAKPPPSPASASGSKERGTPTSGSKEVTPSKLSPSKVTPKKEKADPMRVNPPRRASSKSQEGPTQPKKEEAQTKGKKGKTTPASSSEDSDDSKEEEEEDSSGEEEDSSRSPSAKEEKKEEEREERSPSPVRFQTVERKTPSSSRQMRKDPPSSEKKKPSSATKARK